MDDWITSYYDVPPSRISDTAESHAQCDSIPVARHQMPNVKGGNFKYRSETSSARANKKLDLAVA